MSDENKKRIKELEAELARLKQTDKPVPLPAPDWAALISVVQGYVEDTEPDDDTQHFIYEAAVEAVYGPKVWDYLNARER